MATPYFVIPDTNTIVYSGDKVVLSEYPDNFAIASHGWYEYNQTKANGWYFILLPTKETIPAANVNVSLLTVVSSGHCYPPHPCPIPDPDEHTQARTFITLDNIAQRDEFTPEFIPNGRIVRVNDAGEGKPEYFEWDSETKEWQTWDILQHLENIESDIRTIDERMTSAEDSIASLDSEVSVLNTTVDNLISKVADIEGIVSSVADRVSVTEQSILNLEARLAIAETDLATRKQNDILENALAGLPEMTEEELNVMLENRLNGVV